MQSPAAGQLLSQKPSTSPPLSLLCQLATISFSASQIVHRERATQLVLTVGIEPQ
jgi:hypothetical protein